RPDAEDWIKLNTNGSPYPPSPRVLAALKEAVGDSLRLYPAPMSEPAAEAVGASYGIDPRRVRLGNGGDELIAMCFRAFAGAGDRVAFTWPTYPLLEPLCGIHEAVPSPHPLGKSWSLPASFAADPAPLKFLVNALDTVKDSYNLDRLSIIAAKAAAEDRAYRDRLVSRVVADREWFAGELQALDFLVSPSSANFIFTRPPDGVPASEVIDGLRARRILVRHFSKAPLDGWLRVTIGTREQLAKVLRGIAEVLQR